MVIDRMMRLLAALGVVFVGFMIGLGSAAAAGLVKPLPASAQESADGAIGVVRHRDVALDLNYLARTIAPLGLDEAADRLAKAPKTAAPVRIDLFADVTVLLRRTALGEAFGGGYLWSGAPVRDPGGLAELVIVGGTVTGVIFVDGATYRIDPVGAGGVHRIREVAGRLYPPEAEREPVDAPLPDEIAPLADARAITTVRLLVGYTKKAAAKVGNIKAQINLAVSLANASYKRSKVQVKLQLAGTQSLGGYNELNAASYDAVLEAATQVTTPFKALHKTRDRVKADLVSVLVARTEYCGIAWLIDQPSAASAAYGVSVVTVDCVANYSFQHELGHNMGLDHDRYVSPGAPGSVYNFGYVDLKAKFRTTMAYSNACFDAGFDCPRIPYFANPTVRYKGRPTGVAVGKPKAAYAARRLNETRAGIASYR